MDRIYISEENFVCTNETALPSERIAAGCFLDGNLYESCAEVTVWSQYTTAFYYSMLLIMGEEIEPKSVNEKIFATFLILTGSILVAVIYGSVSMYISNFFSNSNAYQRKMEYLYVGERIVTRVKRSKACCYSFVANSLLRNLQQVREHETLATTAKLAEANPPLLQPHLERISELRRQRQQLHRRTVPPAS